MKITHKAKTSYASYTIIFAEIIKNYKMEIRNDKIIKSFIFIYKR